MQGTSNHATKGAARHPFLRCLAVAAAAFLLASPLAAFAGGAGAMGERSADDSDAADSAADATEDTDASEDAEDDTPVLVGEVSRAEVEAAVPEWVAAEMESTPDLAAVEALAAVEQGAVEPGAEVTVYLGTWCSDSKRELARLWRGFDDAGVGVMTELPFPLTYVAVDRDKVEPAGRLEGVDLEYVPTFVVSRGGEEVGRVVEIAPNGIEHDLLALLSGEAEGVVSGREDLGGGGDGGGDEDTEGDGDNGAEVGAGG